MTSPIHESVSAFERITGAVDHFGAAQAVMFARMQTRQSPFAVPVSTRSPSIAPPPVRAAQRNLLHRATRTLKNLPAKTSPFEPASTPSNRDRSPSQPGNDIRMGNLNASLTAAVAGFVSPTSSKPSAEPTNTGFPANPPSLGRLVKDLAPPQMNPETQSSKPGNVIAESDRFATNQQPYRPDSDNDVETLAGKLEQSITAAVQNALGAILPMLNTIAQGIATVGAADTQKSAFPLHEWLDRQTRKR